MSALRPPAFRGRTRERELLDRLLENVRGGQSAVLVVHGEVGVGKTALLRYAARQALGFRVGRIAGVESEMELPFAGLHQLCTPMLAQLGALPPPQQRALSVALGLTAGDAPDRFLVALATLSLLSEVAEERPLLCLVDDVQWLDGATGQVLGFVARRLEAESVALVFAVREPSDERELAGLPDLPLEGLVEEDARALLATIFPGRLDERFRDRIVAETGGNPLALLELSRELSPALREDGSGWPDTLSLSGRIEESFRRRLEPLGPDARRLMLVAAAEPIGDPAVVWRAAERLGLAVEAITPAELAGLLEIGGRVRFRHPLVRSAVYGAASPQERRDVHRALAEATDAAVEPDRRTWHLAEATGGTDDDVAAELERAADRVQARGGVAAGAAFLARASALTVNPAQRAERALAAAHAKVEAGAFDEALRLLGVAEVGPLDDLQRARVDVLRAQLAFVSSRGRDAPPLLLRAASRLEPLDVARARGTYLDALSAAMFAGRLSDTGGGVLDVAPAARAAPPSPSPRAPDLLLDGLATLFSEGYAVGAPILSRALEAFGRNMSAAEELRWLWLACVTALHLWDDERWDVLSSRHVQLARQAGALTELPLALSSRIYFYLFAGELTGAARLIEETQAATQATGSSLAPYGAVGRAALQGRQAEVSALIETSIEDVVRRGEGIGISVSEWAKAVLYNGGGHYEKALIAAQQASEYPHDLGTSNWAMAELIEAATRVGAHEVAADAHRRLLEATQVSGTDWALGIEARSGALLSDGELAERLYREAIERLSRTRVCVELARARLVYGEWLRRENRRVDAREQLRIAHEMLDTMGVEGFAERARHELLATGEKVRKRRDDTRDELTPQEEHIAGLAREGRTNPEIGAELYLSPRTVEWHLKKVFVKLGISSRKGLHDALPSRDRETTPV